MSAIFDDFIRIGQIGTLLKTTVTRVVSGVEEAVDLTSATLEEIEIQKPSGERLTPFVAVVTDALEGEIEYKDTVGIFDDAGRWKIRGIATFGADEFLGSWFGFGVDE